MLQPVHHQITQFRNPDDFIAILCEGQYSRLTEETLKLGTPVRVMTTGTEGVVSGHNPNDVNRVRVSWFDRADWIVRHKFYDRGVVTRIESTTAPA